MASLSEMLRFQVACGADEAIADAPVDRYAASQPKPAPQPAAAPPASPPPLPAAPRTERPVAAPSPPRPAPRPTPVAAPLISTREAGETARTLSAQALTIAALKDAIEGFNGCDLKLTANRCVFADGNPEAKLMVVGEAPGADEDRMGLPFVGQAGQLLDRMLAAIGLDRTTAYITNIVYWRPPGNRNPTGAELTTCLPFLERHIELVNPAVLVLAGGISAKALLNATEGITKLRGRWFSYQPPGLAKPIPTRAIFHPAYLLRTQAAKREAWRDLIEIKKRLDQAIK
jgi:uracil-DNA glycosylase